jgi:hypothetical protein
MLQTESSASSQAIPRTSESMAFSRSDGARRRLHASASELRAAALAMRIQFSADVEDADLQTVYNRWAEPFLAWSRELYDKRMRMLDGIEGAGSARNIVRALTGGETVLDAFEFRHERAWWQRKPSAEALRILLHLLAGQGLVQLSIIPERRAAWSPVAGRGKESFLFSITPLGLAAMEERNPHAE